MRRRCPQQLDDRGQPCARIDRAGTRRGRGRRVVQRGGHIGDPAHPVDLSGRDRRLRHPGKGGFGRVLRDDAAPGGME